uniref:Methyltransferase-like protein 27 isoform X5 n=1 Tax=Petromyzon marinus TaxID=7757 RepID=A0AAJ7X6U4_PETMA|nr:methyltransferase-like protein 27 isoform X5 [Petromyzon marinus]
MMRTCTCWSTVRRSSRPRCWRLSCPWASGRAPRCWTWRAALGSWLSSVARLRPGIPAPLRIPQRAPRLAHVSNWQDGAATPKSHRRPISQRHALQRLRFGRIRGIDGSSEMLAVAATKGVYESTRRCVLGDGPLPLESDAFDAVIIVGALSDGQVPHAILPELVRVAKPGAPLCLTTRSSAENAEFLLQLEGRMRELSSAGAWRLVRRQEVARWERAIADDAGEAFEGTAPPSYIPGVVYLYRKLD